MVKNFSSQRERVKYNHTVEVFTLASLVGKGEIELGILNRSQSLVSDGHLVVFRKVRQEIDDDGVEADLKGAADGK